MPTDSPYTIADLARLTGVSVRTIRYYLAQGLLPASGESGPGAHYGDGHLDRLRLTKRLQEQHLPLAEIRRQLAALTDEQVAALTTEPAPRTAPATSALDYVRSVLMTQATGVPSRARPASWQLASTPIAQLASASPPEAAAPAAAQSRAPGDDPTGITPETHESPGVHEEAPTAPTAPTALAELAAATAAADATPSTTSPEPPPFERSQWERLSLGPDIELHIRRPLSRKEQRRVERLITIARQVLKEDAT